MRFIWVALTSLVLISNLALAHIERSKNFNNISPRVSYSDGNILILNIDNTLIEPEDLFGSDRWCYQLLKDGLEHQRTLGEASQEAIETWTAAQKTVRVKAVERNIPVLIRSYQEKGAKILLVTSRSPKISEVTFSQLESVGMNFQKSAPFPLNLQTEEFLYQNGVLFVGENLTKTDHKIQALAQFLKIIRFRPHYVSAVAFRKKELDTMEAFFQKNQIEFFGLHYDRLDQQFRDYVKGLFPNPEDLVKKLALYFGPGY